MENENVKREREVSPGDAAARRKLERWLAEMEPMDYDAPGSTVRETGV